jgi:hypothetical protein
VFAPAPAPAPQEYCHITRAGNVSSDRHCAASPDEAKAAADAEFEQRWREAVKNGAFQQARALAAGPFGFVLGYFLGIAVVLGANWLTGGHRRARWHTLAALLAEQEQALVGYERALDFYVGGYDDQGMRARQALRSVAVANGLVEAYLD